MTKCRGFDEDGSVCGRSSMYKSDYCKNHRTQDPSFTVCMGKRGNGRPCVREAMTGALFCRGHRKQLGDIEKLQCPRGCGQLTFRLVNNSGYFHCLECEGTMLDAKSMETRLSEQAATLNHLLERGEECSLRCPRCEGLMLEIRVAYEMPKGGGGGIGNIGGVGHPGALIAVLAIVVIVSVVAAAAESRKKSKSGHEEPIGETMVIDGCRDCGTFWFDANEMGIVTRSTSIKGITATEARMAVEIAEKEAEKSVRSSGRRAANTNCLHVDEKTGKKCRRVTYRSTEYCYMHQPKPKFSGDSMPLW